MIAVLVALASFFTRAGKVEQLAEHAAKHDDRLNKVEREIAGLSAVAHSTNADVQYIRRRVDDMAHTGSRHDPTR